MKGCARTCLLWLLGWGLAAYAFYFYFTTLHHFGPPTYWAAALAGLCVILPIGYAIGIGTAYRERKMLLDAVTGTPPEDGQWVAVSGTIRSMAPLRAPISGTECVAYQYRISKRVRQAKSPSTAVVYDGKALTPSTIAGRHGSVRLLAVPFFDLPMASVSDAAAAANAQRYASATAFESGATPSDRKTTVERESTDDDGMFRVDRAYADAPADMSDCVFEERLVANGATVCAFGLYSRMRGGLIPHPNWAKQTRLMLGDATQVAAQLRSRMLRYLLGRPLLQRRRLRHREDLPVQRGEAHCFLRCRDTYAVISNMLSESLLSKIGRRFASARMRRLFCGSCRSCFLM